MLEKLGTLKRTHMCIDTATAKIGDKVTLMGWVNKRRDFGQLVFIVLRDRTGIVQTFVNEADVDKNLYEKVKNLRSEYVVGLTGTVIERTQENINKKMETGEIEIKISSLKVLSKAEIPPFQVADKGVSEELRMRYRYIDLRREEMQKTFILRHKVMNIVREFLTKEGCIEVETPILNKSTPEGARDYLVPSRVNNGAFYALPQSPQMFKQLLMIAGFDRYFQIVKCFRDEDLRADRQPEFTQIDIEMSFVDEEDIMEINERLLKNIFKKALGIELENSIPRMKYKESMERFGVDKPDLRYDMELVNITDTVKNSDFIVFENAIKNGGSVRGINIVGGNGHFSRKKIDKLVDFVKDYKAKGLAWINITDTGENKTTISKFFDNDKIEEIKEKFNAKNGDLILLCADKDKIVFDALGNLRVEVAKILKLPNKNSYKPVWITDFPLFEFDEDDNRYYAMHHPFTHPKDEHIDKLDNDRGNVIAKAYDLVINGYEVGGGSIRISNNEIQEKMFNALGFTKEELEAEFGFFLEAFKYGVPPHGGMAWGFDRLVMILSKIDSIRDVIAFPKTKEASCILTNTPSKVSNQQLKELGLLLDNKEDKK